MKPTTHFVLLRATLHPFDVVAAVLDPADQNRLAEDGEIDVRTLQRWLRGEPVSARTYRDIRFALALGGLDVPARVRVIETIAA
jgi:hypothetical protein